MAYEQQEWVAGDRITAEKLNHMEDGIYDASQSGGGTLVVRVDHTEGSGSNRNIIFDKTWQEVKDALASGKRVITLYDTMIGAFQQIILETGENPFMVKGIKCGDPISETITLFACSADGYLQSKQCDSEGGGGNDPIT